MILDQPPPPPDNFPAGGLPPTPHTYMMSAYQDGLGMHHTDRRQR